MKNSARLKRAGLRDLLTLSIVIPVLCLSSWAQAAVTSATVAHAEGETYLLRGGSLAAPLQSTRKLQAGDRVSTGRSGHLELLFGDGAKMTLGPRTALVITRYKLDEERSESIFDLAKGTLRTITGQIGKLNPAGFQLRTPTAIMGVRGTDFTVVQRDCSRVACQGSGAPLTSLQVTAGRVTFTTAAGTLEVPAGRSASLNSSGEMPKIVRLEPTESSPRPENRIRSNTPKSRAGTSGSKPPDGGGANPFR